MLMQEYQLKNLKDRVSKTSSRNKPRGKQQPLKPKAPTESGESAWRASRHGAWSGRGYRYQDIIGRHITILAWAGQLSADVITPEGLEDFSVESSIRPIEVQVKSRGAASAAMTAVQVADYLLNIYQVQRDRLNTNPTLALALWVERLPVEWRESGWDKRMSDCLVEPQAAKLSERWIERGLTPVECSLLLQRTHLIEGSDVDAIDLELVSNLLNLPPAVCYFHMHRLTLRIGELSDANATRSQTNRASVSIPEVQQLFDEVTAAVDVSSLTEALQSGVCQRVDFTTPIEDEEFYLGVDVVPGHLAAELVIDRPESVVDVLDGMEVRRSVLIVGPSGAGKSAVAWLAAKQSSRHILWYRSSRLVDDDIGPVLRLLDAALPAKTGPVGLVVDNLGELGKEAWDRLVEEIQHRENAFLLGVVRREDFPVLQSANKSHVVWLTLDETLGQEIFAALANRQLTSEASWHEAFHKAHGLLLEYTHMLTTGRRLQETIARQIQTRLLDEKRDLEVDVLRYASIAHVCGVGLTLSILSQLTHADEPALRRAFMRLNEEHLVRLREDDVVEGIHLLRSTAIVRTLSEFPPPTMRQVLERFLPFLDGAVAITLLTGAEEQGFVDGPNLVDMLASHVNDHGVPSRLAVALQVLQIAEISEKGREWNRIMESCRVPIAHRLTAASLALTSSEILPMLLDEIQRAIPQMKQVTVLDLRGQLMHSLGEDQIARLWSEADDSERRCLIASFTSQGARLIPEAVLPPLVSITQSSNLNDAAECLMHLRMIDPTLAQQVLESAGGEHWMLERVRAELPWVRNVEYETDADGLATVSGEYAVVDGDEDAHSAVVGICHLAFDLLPSAGVAAFTAVDASGKPSGYKDFAVAIKHIPRANLPPAPMVDLNRRVLWACARSVSFSSRTQRLTAEAEILRNLADVLTTAVDDWLLGRRSLSKNLGRRFEWLQERAKALPAAWTRETIDTIASGGDIPRDTVSGLVMGVSNNLVPRLYMTKEPGTLVGLAAGLAGDELAELSREDRWELVENPPTASLQRAQSVLRDLSTVLSEMGHSTASLHRIQHAVRQIRGGQPLATATREAINIENERVNIWCTRLTECYRALGFEVAIFVRDLPPSEAIGRPPIQILLAVDVPSVIAFVNAVPDLIGAAREIVGPFVPLVLAPRRDQKAIALLALRVIRDFFPDTDFLANWTMQPDLLFQETPIATGFDLVVKALTQASAMIDACHEPHPLPVEAAALDAAVERANLGLEYLHNVSEEHCNDSHLVEALEVADLLGVRVMSEARGDQAVLADGTVAGLLTDAVSHDGSNNLASTVIGARLFLAEWEIDPSGAAKRLGLQA